MYIRIENFPAGTTVEQIREFLGDSDEIEEVMVSNAGNEDNVIAMVKVKASQAGAGGIAVGVLGVRMPGAHIAAIGNAIAVGVLVIGSGGDGTVMGVVFQIAPEDRERAGDRVRAVTTLRKGDEIVDRARREEFIETEDFPEEDLPVLLPDVESYSPTEDGNSPSRVFRRGVGFGYERCLSGFWHDRG